MSSEAQTYEKNVGGESSCWEEDEDVSEPLTATEKQIYSRHTYSASYQQMNPSWIPKEHHVVLVKLN